MGPDFFDWRTVFSTSVLFFFAIVPRYTGKVIKSTVYIPHFNLQ